MLTKQKSICIYKDTDLHKELAHLWKDIKEQFPDAVLLTTGKETPIGIITAHYISGKKIGYISTSTYSSEPILKFKDFFHSSNNECFNKNSEFWLDKMYFNLIYLGFNPLDKG